jgi:hypothetical protein
MFNCIVKLKNIIGFSVNVLLNKIIKYFQKIK